MKGKVAVVTGGANGIGRAIVEELRARGCVVILIDREPALGFFDDGGIVSFVGDVSDGDMTASIVSEAAARFGGIDYLVNCAGSFIAAGEHATAAEWDAILSVNVRGSALLSAAVAPHMRARSGGAIVNVGSISGHVAQPHRWTYNASKGALQALTKCQAMDFAKDSIRVNIVSPGWIWTREVERAAEGDATRAGELWGDYALLGRLGRTAEVAKAVVFLLSDDASFITGADIPVDGGYLAMGPEGRGATSTFAGTT